VSSGRSAEHVAERLPNELVEVDRQRSIWTRVVAEVHEEELPLLGHRSALAQRTIELPHVPDARLLGLALSLRLWLWLWFWLGFWLGFWLWLWLGFRLRYHGDRLGLRFRFRFRFGLWLDRDRFGFRFRFGLDRDRFGFWFWFRFRLWLDRFGLELRLGLDVGRLRCARQHAHHFACDRIGLSRHFTERRRLCAVARVRERILDHRDHHPHDGDGAADPPGTEVSEAGDDGRQHDHDGLH
jgi:hypothetical protein